MQSHRLWLSLFLVHFIKNEIISEHAMMLCDCHLRNSAVPQEEPQPLPIGDMHLLPARWLDRRYVDIKACLCLLAESANMGVPLRSASLTSTGASFEAEWCDSCGAAERHQIIKRCPCGFAVLPALIATTKSIARDRHPCEMHCLAVEFHLTI